MDLLQTVRKEGSRGGVNFSWDDVKSSQHRENYLGHSLKAPVGRWQKNRDLNWYAKDADDADLTPEQRAEREGEQKREEMRKIKEAEEDAMARALGLPVPDRTNANNEPLGGGKVSQQEVNQALKEALGDGEEDAERAGGVGAETSTVKKRDRSRSRDRRHRSDRHERRYRRSRSRSRDRDRDRRHRHRRSHRSRSPSTSRTKSRRSRSRHRYDDRRHDDGRQRERRDDCERRRSHDRDRRRERSRDR